MEKKLKRNLSTSKDKDATKRVHFAFKNIKARPALLSNISQGQRQNCRNCEICGEKRSHQTVGRI